MSRLNVANFRHPDGTADNINITSGGDVGIGTSSPNDNYGTNLAVHDSGTVGARLKLSTSATGEGNLDGFDLISTGSNAYVTNRESGTLALASNNTAAAEIASGGEFRFNSGFGSVATAYGVRAFAVFDGASPGSPDITRNVSTIGDNGVGRFTINFTNSMPDTNYAFSGGSGNATTTTTSIRSVNRDGTFTTSAAPIRVGFGSTATDDDYISVMFVR